MIYIFSWTPPESSPKDFGNADTVATWGQRGSTRKNEKQKSKQNQMTKSEWGGTIGVVFPQLSNPEMANT